MISERLDTSESVRTHAAQRACARSRRAVGVLPNKALHPTALCTAGEFQGVRRAGGPGNRTAAPLHATVSLVAREQAAARTAPPRAHDAKHVEPGSVRSVIWESDVKLAA